jgi:thymidylate kinase
LTHEPSPTACSLSDFCRLFFRELTQQNIPYVVLHSYEDFPAQVSSDVDYAVLTRDLPRLSEVQRRLAREHGWVLAHAVEAHIYAHYCVFVDLEQVGKTVLLDACGHYVEAGCFLLADEMLLEGRTRCGEVFAPAPGVEFAYLLAKVLAKNKPLEERLPRLRELWQKGRAESEAHFQRLMGDTGRTLAEWFGKPASDWEQLRFPMLRRNRFGWGDRLREVGRAWRRTTRPTGLHLAVLGSDGSGKSTLLNNLNESVGKSFFRRQRQFHFRTQVFERGKSRGPVTDPHGKVPRSHVAGTAKLLYYFLDNMVGYWVKVFPDKVFNGLVLFDRTFDDLLVDPRRYRFTRVGRLVRVLRQLLPRPDLTLVLDASPERIYERKRELPLEELQRQRVVFHELAKDPRRYVLISTERPPEEVAQQAFREVVRFLAERTERYEGKTSGFKS